MFCELIPTNGDIITERYLHAVATPVENTIDNCCIDRSRSHSQGHHVGEKDTVVDCNGASTEDEHATVATDDRYTL